MTSLFAKMTTLVLPDPRRGYHLADTLRSLSLARKRDVFRGRRRRREDSTYRLSVPHAPRGSFVDPLNIIIRLVAVAERSHVRP